MTVQEATGFSSRPGYDPAQIDCRRETLTCVSATRRVETECPARYCPTCANAQPDPVRAELWPSPVPREARRPSLRADRCCPLVISSTNTALANDRPRIPPIRTATTKNTQQHDLHIIRPARLQVIWNLMPTLHGEHLEERVSRTQWITNMFRRSAPKEHVGAERKDEIENKQREEHRHGSLEREPHLSVGRNQSSWSLA